MRVGLNTILLLPILYGIWRTQGGSGEGRILPNHRAIVSQQCGQCRRARKGKGRLIRAQTTRSKTISCTGQNERETQIDDLGLNRAPPRYPTRGFSLYKIFFHFEAVVHESIIISFPPPTCIAHPGAILLHDYWTVYDSDSDLPCVCYWEVARTVVVPPSSVVKCLWEVFVWGFRVLFLSCVSVSGVLLSVCVCV